MNSSTDTSNVWGNTFDLNFSLPSWVIIIILIFAIVLIIFIIKAIKSSKDKPLEANDEYGSARFATEKELHHDFDKENLDDIQEFGFPIWFDKDLKYMLVDRQTPHWLFLGSTGSGKSLTSVKPQAAMIATAKKKRSVFFTDPKGELFGDVAKVFQENGYKVITLDFRNPTLSNKMNLLEPVIAEWEIYFKKKKEYINLEFEIEVGKDKLKELQTLYESTKDLQKQEEYKKQLDDLTDDLIIKDGTKTELINESMTSYGEAVRLVGTISDMITAEDNAKDPFFNASAGNLLAGLIFFFLEKYEEGEITRDKITLNTISKFQTSTTEENNSKKFKRIVEAISYDKNSKLRLTNVIGASENTYKSITAVFGQKMSIFNDLNVSNVTSASDFDFDVLGKGYKTIDENGNEITQPVAMFVIVRDEDESYNVLVTLIVGLMYKCLVKLAVNSPKQRLPIDIVFMLDEFANCPALPSISAMVTVARSRGMMFQFYIQEFSQLDKVYGKEVANIIKGNCGLVYLKTTSYDTAELVSKRLGKKTITQESFSRGIGLKESFGGNKNTSLTGRDVFTPDEIMGLEYKTIIFPIKKSYPIFRSTVPYFDFTKKYPKIYYEGTVNRNSYVLSRLEDKTFTIENCANVEIKDSSAVMRNKKSISKENYVNAQKKFFDDKTEEAMAQQDRQYLEPAIKQAKQLLGDNVASEEILSQNGRSFARIITKTIIDKSVEEKLNKINENQQRIAYVIQTSIKDNVSIISIHINLFPTAEFGFDLNNVKPVQANS